MLVFFLIAHFEGLSQNSGDTLCFPRDEAVRVYAAALQKRVLDSVIIRMQSDVANYELSIGSLQAALSAYVAKDSSVSQSHRREVALLELRDKERSTRVTELEKSLRKQTWRTRLAALAGVVFGVGVLVLR